MSWIPVEARPHRGRTSAPSDRRIFVNPKDVPIIVEAAGQTDKGLLRKENQDAFVVTDEILLVADGMGGCGGGAVAASIVAAQLPYAAARLRCDDADLGEAIRDALQEINDLVRKRGQEHPDLTMMGASLVFTLVRDDRVFLVSLGDSRAYRLREETIEKLTREHTIGAALLEARAIDEEKLSVHPLRNALARYVGMPGRVEPDVTCVEAEPGDWLLLCSDGICAIDEENLAGIVASASSATEACALLIEAANAGGGHDNTTVVLARFGPSGG